jgi:superfamily I DNA/RNA helicase
LSMGSCQRACRFAASCGVHHPYRVLIRPRLLAGPFAHIVVDEAQELTDAEWQMLLLRCPSRSFTIVGDRVQARHGFTESWQERLERIGLDRINLASLNIN